MNVLSLFTGAGGGELAFQHLLTGFTTVGYVEYEPYCQAVIRQRISDGLLDDAPIFSDIKNFISEGWAESYKGMVDVVTAGFPCQPFSVAGKQKGKEDARNMWPETMSVLRMVRPRYAFLENVPGLLASGYMPQIFSDLAEIGYNARWFVLGADDVGANHRRKRLWVLAYSTQELFDRCWYTGQGWRPESTDESQEISNPKSQYCNVNHDNRKNSECNISEFRNGGCKGTVANPKSRGVRSGKHENEEIFMERSAERQARSTISSRSRGTIWTTEPALG